MEVRVTLWIFDSLVERRDTADITEVLKELHRIVNQTIAASGPGGDQTASKTYDLSKIDFDRLRQEFAKNVRRKNTALKDIRDVVEAKLQAMLARNPERMDFYKRYQEIIADYNREKDRVTIEETFARLLAFSQGIDAEQRRAVEEGPTEEAENLAGRIYNFVFQQAASGAGFRGSSAA